MRQSHGFNGLPNSHYDVFPQIALRVMTFFEQVTCRGHVSDRGKLNHRLRPQVLHAVDDRAVILWISTTSAECVLLSLL